MKSIFPILCLWLFIPVLSKAQNNPIFFADTAGHIKCLNCVPGDTGSVNGIVYEAVDRNLLNQRRDQGADLTKLCTSLVTDMSLLFYGNQSFNQDISNWDVSHVNNMSAMFRASTYNQSIANWDVSQVTNMSSMFYDAAQFNQPIGSWDVSHVTTMSGMFCNASNFNQPISNWDVSTVTDMNNMFRASGFQQPIGNWNVSSVTNMSYMFYDAAQFNQPIGIWDVSHVTNMSGMFCNANNFNQPINSWNVSAVTDMNTMFRSSGFHQPIGNWNVGSVTNMNLMFYENHQFNQSIGYWDVSHVTNMEAMFWNASSFNQAINSWCVTQIPSAPNGFSSNCPLVSGFKPIWGTCTNQAPAQLLFFADTAGHIKCINCIPGDTGTVNGIVYEAVDRNLLNQRRDQGADLTKLCTSLVKDMSNLFNGNQTFNQDISNWDVSSVTNMANMFFGDYAFNQPIGSWEVDSVTNMAGLFADCHFNQPIGNWHVSSVTNMGAMFSQNTFFNQDISTWDVSAVTNMDVMFFRAYAFNQPIGNWNVHSVTSMSGMFVETFQFDQPLNSWIVGNVTNMNDMFFGSHFNQTIDNWDVSHVVSMSRMFLGDTNFNQPIGNWNVGQVTNMWQMFYGANKFNQNISGWDVHNVVEMSGMFGNTTFNQPIGNWNVSHVTNMSEMFRGNTVFNQSIGNWNMSHVSNMENMFYQANNFNQPIGNWDVSHVTNMGGMFCGAVNFNQNIDNWNVSHVINMGAMFMGNGNSSFNQPLGHWNVSSVTNFTWMFDGAAAFNQPINTWCVALIPSAPINFSSSSPLQTAYLPQWGTCPTVTPFADTAICLGNSAVIWAPAAPAYLGSPLHYTWSTGDTTLTLAVTPQQTTNYVCTISDGIQSYSDTIQIRVDTIAPNFIVSDTVFSCSPQVNLAAAAGYDSYFWNTGQTSASFQPQGSGRYTCTVTHGACSAMDAVLYQHADIAQSDTSLCAGEPLNLSINNISDNGLLGYWEFSGNTLNSIPGGLQATFSQVELDSNRQGMSHQALGFHTKNGSMTIPYVNTPEISISMWYQYGGTAGNWNTLACWDGGSYHHMIISPSGELGYYNNGFYGCGFFPQYGQWYHLILIKNGTQSKLYVNDSLVQSTNQSFSNQDFPLRTLGNFTANEIQGALGSIDEIIIFNRALQASEVVLLTSQPFSYAHALSHLWSTGDTINHLIVSPTQSQTYYCIVNNGNSSCTDSVTVTVNPLPQNPIAQDTIIACADSMIVTAAAGYSHYQWSNGDTTQSIVAKQTGTYTLRVTNANGCVGKDTVLVSILRVNTNADTNLCAGASIQLSNSDAELNRYFVNIYQNSFDQLSNDWTNPKIFNFNGNSLMGPYSNESASISRIINQPHDSVYIQFEFYPHDTWDQNEPFEFSLNGTTLATVYFHGWALQADSHFQYMGTVPGRCQTYFQFFNKYLATFKVANTSPLLNFAISQSSGQDICDESWSIDNFNIDIKVHYPELWSTGDTTSTINVTPTQTTTYYCTVSNGISSCTDSVTVTVNPLPTNFFTQDTLKVCNTSTTLIAPSNGSYSWSNGSTAQSITVNNTGWYACMFTNSNGCTSSDSVFVQLSSPSSATNNATACGSYTWPANGQSYTQSGTYTRTSLNASGCTQADTLQLNIQVCQTELHLGCLLDGYYDGNAGMVPVLQNQGEATTAGACDTIHVELHSDTAPYLLETSTNTVLQQNGTAICIFPYQTGSKYIVVKHRNAIETWSAQPINMGAVVNYDFRTSASKAYANNQVDVSGNGTIWALFTGDINQDQNVDLLDMPILEEDIALYMFGYTATDLNGDGNTDLLDVIYLDYGIANYVFSYHP